MFNQRQALTHKRYLEAALVPRADPADWGDGWRGRVLDVPAAMKNLSKLRQGGQSEGPSDHSDIGHGFLDLENQPAG